MEQLWTRRVLAIGSALAAVVAVTATVLSLVDRGGGDSSPPSGARPPPPVETTPPPAPVDGDQAVFERVDRVLATLPVGSVAFNAPETLAEGESAEIELLLSLQQSIDRLKEQIAEAGRREGERVRIADEMEATLTGAGFEIETIGPSRQAVSRRDVTRWKWEVTPTRTGVLRLHLTLTGFVDVAGERRPRAIRTFERTLVVRVTWSERVMAFVKGNWQWLWTAILAPLAVWFVRRRRGANGDGSRRGGRRRLSRRGSPSERRRRSRSGRRRRLLKRGRTSSPPKPPSN